MKVEVLDIEHVEHANRIIIKYKLLYDTANFASEGWVYIANACGYKGICDDDWICMTPNTQHPLHSDNIKAAGIYYFVWDYHGVGGLTNEDFTSTHSFVVQLALHDTGCDYIDPCIEDPNLTPDGDIVEGNVGEEGNCGEGWLIVLDDRGCLMCQKIPPSCSNTVPEGPNAGALVAGSPGTQGNCGPGYVVALDANGCPYCRSITDNTSTPPGTGIPPTIKEPPDDPGGGPPNTDDFGQGTINEPGGDPFVGGFQGGTLNDPPDNPPPNLGGFGGGVILDPPNDPPPPNTDVFTPAILNGGDVTDPPKQGGFGGGILNDPPPDDPPPPGQAGFGGGTLNGGGDPDPGLGGYGGGILNGGGDDPNPGTQTFGGGTLNGGGPPPGGGGGKIIEPGGDLGGHNGDGIIGDGGNGGPNVDTWGGGILADWPPGNGFNTDDFHGGDLNGGGDNGPPFSDGWGEGEINDGGNNDGDSPNNEVFQSGHLQDPNNPTPPNVDDWDEGSISNGGNKGGGLGGTATSAGSAGSYDGYVNYFNSYVNNPKFTPAHFFVPTSQDVPTGPTVIGTGPKLTQATTINFTGEGRYNYPGYQSTNVLGELPNWVNANGNNASIGDGTYVTHIGPVRRSTVNLVDGAYGGRIPYAINTLNLPNSNKYNSYITKRFSPQNDPPSDNELGITTRHFKHAQNITLNNTAGASSFRGNTSIKNAISVSSNIGYIESSQNFKSQSAFLKSSDVNINISKAKISTIGHPHRYRETRPALKNLHSRNKAKERNFGTQFYGPISSSFERNISLSSRSPSRNTTNRNQLAAKNYELTRSDKGFTARNKYGLSVVPSSGAVGATFHASCYVKPLDRNDIQTLSLELYIRDSNGTNQLSKKTHRVATRSPRKLAGPISTKDLVPGPASIFFVVKNSKGKVIFKESKNITLTSPGQLAGVPDLAVLNSLGATSNNFVSGLISKRSITSIVLPVGSTKESPLKLILNKDSAPTRVKLGVQTISLRGKRKHSISLFNITGFAESQSNSNQTVYLSDELLARNNPDAAGPNITNNPSNTSGVTYTELLSSDVSSQVIATISNHIDRTTSLVKIEVGGNISLVETSVTTSTYNGDGTYDFVIQTPFAFTNLSLFETGGNNVVSSSATVTNVKTTQTGVATITMSFNRDAWLGIALKEPSSLPLPSRVFFFKKIE